MAATAAVRPNPNHRLRPDCMPSRKAALLPRRPPRPGRLPPASWRPCCCAASRSLLGADPDLMSHGLSASTDTYLDDRDSTDRSEGINQLGHSDRFLV